ncbi:MAG: HNH endonuclease [Actinobacteria bacterium HGW-Actinobacteria-2]|nr:MAG: HNH endonuclease [Actinobacteria bacterium HGW-Actinobacteria-2]
MNAGRAKVYARRRKRRMRGRTHDLTDAQWAALVAAWGGCAYCGSATGSLEKDCMLPIANGGRYTLSNVVPACRSCNASKWNAEVTSWLRRKRLDEAAFLTRQREIFTQLEAELDASAATPGTDD